MKTLTNSAAVMKTMEVIELEERPLLVSGPLEVLVLTDTVTLCGSDIHYFEHGRVADYDVNSPIVLGHEASRTIAENGPGVDPDSPVRFRTRSCSVLRPPGTIRPFPRMQRC